MSEAKTSPEVEAVETFIANVANKGRREDAVQLDKVFREVTGWSPQLWGTMIGYGSYDYTYDTGHSGTALATGFAPRSGNMVVYIMPGYADFGPILDRLGKYKMGKACLYLGRLSGVDEAVLRELIAAGLEDLGKRWTITPG